MMSKIDEGLGLVCLQFLKRVFCFEKQGEQKKKIEKTHLVSVFFFFLNEKTQKPQKILY